MKFRTDFVTNSSSTSYISIHLKFLDGRDVALFGDEFEGTEMAYYAKIKKEKLNTETPFTDFNDLLEAIRSLYSVQDDFFDIVKETKQGLEEFKGQEDIMTKLVISVHNRPSSEGLERVEEAIVDFEKKIITTDTYSTGLDDEDFDWDEEGEY